MTLIEALLDHQIPQSLHLSPSGQQVIYASTVHTSDHVAGHDDARNTSILWLASTGKEKSARQLTPGKCNDREPKWCPDGESVAFISDRGSEKGKKGEAIYFLPISMPGESRAVTKVENEKTIAKFEFSPDGKSIAFLSANEKSEEKKKRDEAKEDAMVWGEEWEYARLRLLDLATGAIDVLVEGERHVKDFAFSPDGRSVAFLSCRTPDIESPYLDGTGIFVIDIATKESRELSMFPTGARDIVWKDEKTLCFIGSVAQTVSTSASCVYSVTVPTDKNKTESGDNEQAAEKKEIKYTHLAYGSIAGAENLVRVGNDILVFVQERMYDTLRLLDGDRTLFTRKRKLYAWTAAFTRDSDEIVLAVVQGWTNSPVEVYTCTASSGAMVRLSDHGGRYHDKEEEFGRCTWLTCKSLDGEEELECPLLIPLSTTTSSDLSTSPTDPPKPPTKPLPMIVLIHGGPYYRHTESFDPHYFLWAPLLLRAGYAVLIADYRGSSARGETWAAHARKSGGKDYEDVIAQTNAAITQGWADKERLVVGGWSQGGFLTYLCSVRNGLHGLGWSFAASIPGAGIVDGDTMTLTSDIGHWEAELLSPGPAWSCNNRNMTSGRQTSALWELRGALEKGVRLPAMLMLHGEKDVRVPVEQARGMRRGLERCKRDGCEGVGEWGLVVYPREGHMISERGHLVDMSQRVVGWVERHVGKAE